MKFNKFIFALAAIAVISLSASAQPASTGNAGFYYGQGGFQVISAFSSGPGATNAWNLNTSTNFYAAYVGGATTNPPISPILINAGKTFYVGSAYTPMVSTNSTNTILIARCPDGVNPETVPAFVAQYIAGATTSRQYWMTSFVADSAMYILPVAYTNGCAGAITNPVVGIGTKPPF
jgi:hypothetical protein